MVEVSFHVLAAHPERERERERENGCGGWPSPFGVIQSLLNDILEKHNEPLLTDRIDELCYC